MVQSEPGPRIILITGASRGIGAEIATQLGDRQHRIIVNYREKARRANEVVDAIRRRGGDALAVQADLCDEPAVDAMLDEINRRFGRLDVMVLNASGGMEHDADADYAMRLNCDAQIHLARRALPLMPPGGRIVFVTSHQAHFLERKPVPVDYRAVAVSKRAGETALREMRTTLEANGIALVVVSGDMIDGTITVKLLERRDPDAVAARRAAGRLPSIPEFAGAVVRATHAPDTDGQIIYVGGSDYL